MSVATKNPFAILDGQCPIPKYSIKSSLSFTSLQLRILLVLQVPPLRPPLRALNLSQPLQLEGIKRVEVVPLLEVVGTTPEVVLLIKVGTKILKRLRLPLVMIRHRGSVSQHIRPIKQDPSSHVFLPPVDGNGRGRGKGRGRGDRSRAGPDGGGGRGRQFDRHSQTGKTYVTLVSAYALALTFFQSDSDKKVHQSWGGDDGITELKVEEAATNDAAVEDTNDWAGNTTNDWDTPAPPAADDPWAVPVSNDAPNAELEPTDKTAGEREPRRGREREPEEEDNTLTLPQYLAQKKDIEGIPKLDGPRKANEGVDDNIWKDVVPLKKDEEGNSYFVGKVIISGLVPNFL